MCPRDLVRGIAASGSTRGGRRSSASCTTSSPNEELLGAADTWCTRIAALPAHAIAMTKPLLRAAADGSWESTLVIGEFAEPHCVTTDAFQEAVRGMPGESGGRSPG